jgi:L-threonylcarbamoyladenylate synthase
MGTLEGEGYRTSRAPQNGLKGAEIAGELAMAFISNCTADVIAKAAQALKDGHLVAFPTETVYGLGADSQSEDAAAKIYKAKGRPADHPLIVHVSSMAALREWASDVPEYAIALARKFWPGPMTLVVKRSELAKDFVTGGQDTVGIRVPEHVVALALLQEFERIGGLGVAAPSANRFGAVSPTTASAVEDELADYLSADDLVLDGGPSQVGVESTIIDCTGNLPRVLRLGAVTVEMIEAITGLSVNGILERTAIRVSGSLESHYAPKARVVLNEVAQSGDGFIATADVETPAGAIRLAAPKNVDEYATALYSSLRAADERGLEKVVAIEPQGIGLAEAIRDRLTRAAHGA